MRRRLAALASAGAIALTGLMAPAASAVPAETSPRTLPPTLAVHPEWGAVAATSGKLRKGCKSYPYSYSFTPPEGDWAVETFVTGPSGEALWSGGFLSGSDALSGSSVFTFCRQATTEGTYTLEAKVSVQNGPGQENYTEGQLPPVTFTLIKAVKQVRDSVIVPCC